MATPPDLEERTRRSLRRFAAEITPGESDLYRRLTAGIAEDDGLVDVALVAAARRQPPANMLLGAGSETAVDQLTTAS
jgi:hypothetical protein